MGLSEGEVAMTASMLRGVGREKVAEHRDATLGWLRPLFIIVFAIAAVLIADANAWADSPTVAKVEEDWEVQIATPDPEGNAPQIITVISPNANIDAVHTVFELNHITQPDYAAGGMQLQCWKQGAMAHHHSFHNANVLSTVGEVITYTTRMSVSGDRLYVEICDGDSTTWSDFGDHGHLKCSTSTTLNDLSNYSPSVSVSKSRVGFAANRVTKLVLKRVRYYEADGTLISTDSTERVVHQLTVE